MVAVAPFWIYIPFILDGQRVLGEDTVGGQGLKGTQKGGTRVCE